MTKEKESIEILMATWNGTAYLREQMDSILAQTDTGWHLTVSDDGSTDGTERVLEEYARHFPGKVGRVVSGRRFGNARDHFFFLISHCDRDWMMLSDQDDTWEPQKIAKFREAMKNAQEQFGANTPLLIFCDQVPTDAELRPLSPSLMRYQNQYFEAFDYRSILMQNVVTGGAMALNRPLARLALPGWQKPDVIQHDWWIAAVAARFGKIVYLDDPLGTYRQHAENLVGAKAVNSAAYVKDRLGKLAEVKETIRKKKAQAAAFEETYREKLIEEDMLFLRGFEREKSGMLFYWKYRALLHGFARKAGMMILG